MCVPRPRRDVQYIPIQYKGQPYVMVQDRLGLVKEGILLPPNLYGVLLLLDRCTSIEEVQVTLTRQQGGLLVSKEEVLSLIEYMDRLNLLDTERLEKEKKRLVEEFSSLSMRPFVFGDRAYPSDRGSLSRFVEEILSESPPSPFDSPPKAVIAPHIDIGVGRKGYAASYSALKGLSYENVVILGIGHGLSEGVYCVSTKDFDTPFGLVENHGDATSYLLEMGSSVVSPNDFEHKFEHSIEFQLVFLKYLLGDFKLVPILCGSLGYFLPEYRRDIFLERCGPFLDALSEVVSWDNTLVVAGVDFSHIGPKFGHERDVYALKEEASSHDRSLLDALCERDMDEMWRISAQVEDRYNVCGFSALATLGEVVGYTYMRVLHYEMSVEPPTSSGVGFASAVLF